MDDAGADAAPCDAAGAVVCAGVRVLLDPRTPPHCYALDSLGRVEALHPAEPATCAAAAALARLPRDLVAPPDAAVEPALQPVYATMGALRAAALADASAAADVAAARFPALRLRALPLPPPLALEPPPFVARLVSVAVGYGLFAARRLSPRVVVGEYVGVVGRDDDGRATAADDYYRVALPAVLPDGVPLHVSARAVGSPMRLINHAPPAAACRAAGGGAVPPGPRGAGDDRAANVGFVALVARGLPRVLCVTLSAVEPGAELLADYGVGYWAARASRAALADGAEPATRTIECGPSLARDATSM